jgi:putative hydrolase of HD superfamily
VKSKGVCNNFSMLDKSLNFLKFLREFEKIERTIYRPGEIEKAENDAEHSYQVAMMAWFLNNEFDLGLSLEKLLKYGLAHDLVETYSGDTPVYNHIVKSENSIDTKEQREKLAFERIKKEFGEFDDLIETIENYENKIDDESVFVYELDKIIPVLNIYLDKGYSWKKLKLKIEDLETQKRSKVKKVSQLVDLLEDLLDAMNRDKDKLFNQ